MWSLLKRHMQHHATVPQNGTPDARDTGERQVETLIQMSRMRYAVPIATSADPITASLPPISDIPPQHPDHVIVEPDQHAPLIKSATQPTNTRLSQEERQFAAFIHAHPGMFVTHIYQELGLSGYKGNRLKEELKAKGLLTETTTRMGTGGKIAKVLALTEQALPLLQVTPYPGKGGMLHRSLQAAARIQAEALGFQATVEEPIPGSHESVDLSVEQEGRRTAIEISVTTGAKHELANIRKALEGGYSNVILVVPDPKRLAPIRRRIKRMLTSEEHARVQFSIVSDLKTAIVRPRSVDSVHSAGKYPPLKSDQKQLWLF